MKRNGFQFINDWVEALKPRKNLHLTKLRWNRRYKKIVADLAKLGPIPHRYNLSPVRAGMWHQDFEDFWKGKVRETYANPYIACAQICMATTLTEIVGPNDEIEFIFDWQEGRRAHTMDTLHQTVFKFAKMDKRVKTIDFRPMQSTVCLDPADYLVFALRENAIDETSKKAKATLPILSKPIHGGNLLREQVKTMADKYIAAGMVPGGGPIKMSDELAAALLKAGWSESRIDTFATTALSGRLPPEKKGIA